jgi:hypothetical protein
MSEDRIRGLVIEDSPSDAQLLCESLQDYPLQQFDMDCDSLVLVSCIFCSLLNLSSCQ